MKNRLECGVPRAILMAAAIIIWGAGAVEPSRVLAQHATSSGQTSSGAAAKSRFGIATPPVVATSRVIGSPETPPPFRVKRLYPKLKLNFPIAVERQPGTDLLWFIQQPRPYSATTIHRFRDDQDVDSFETLLSPDESAYSLAFHPKFAENGYVYVGSNAPFSGPGEAKKSRVTRYTVERSAPYRVDPASAKVIIEWASNGHNGAALGFGHDGMLYVTSGDGTSDSDTNLAGQGLDHLLAKVLRIDVDRPEGDRAYRVPTDNPFVGQANVRPETWAYGLRNPWRLAVDRKTGHIWVGNNGQDLWEQVYFVRKGDNYGWSVMEGSHPFYLQRQAGPTPFVKPAAEHPHSEARSLTGGYVYYGSRYPELQGVYLYGDYSTGKIWGVRHDGQKIVWQRELADSTLAITGFGPDTRDEILICDHRGENEGAFYTLEPMPAEAADVARDFPRKLSDTGLFESVAGHVVRPTLIPYSVNSPLWSDGAHKERFLALTVADPKIDLGGNRGWNLPNGTVLVKSFAIETKQGDPKSRRWIETRLMTRHENEWLGFSYRWNDEQTEAHLVESAGADGEYAIQVPASEKHPDGTRKLAWHYPSRTECMVCHSRAANYVLGLSTAQMNREQAYGDVHENQLVALEELGLLKTSGKSGDKLAPEKFARLANPYDADADLTLRVRAYLHANCSHCHVEAGGGNAQMQLESNTVLDKMNVLDAKPMHHTFEIPDAKIVARGAPERSVLLHRLSRRGTGQMPPLASTIPDDEAIALLRKWIESLR